MGDQSMQPMAPHTAPDAYRDRLAWLCNHVALARLVGGLVHEVNNPTTFIMLAASQLERLCAPGSDGSRSLAKELVGNVAESARSIRGAVSEFQLLLSAAKGPMTGYIDLQHVLQAAVSPDDHRASHASACASGHLAPSRVPSSLHRARQCPRAPAAQCHPGGSRGNRLTP